MTDTKVVRHRLTNRDESTLTAECSVCGFVSMRKAGNGFMCAVKKADAQKAWASKSPAKAAANRRQRSDHTLFNRDYTRLTADCSACQTEVDLVMYGAGYACGVRARELRTVQQATMAGQRCRECAIIDGPAKAPRVRADGTCPRCEDPRLSDTGSVLRDQEYAYGLGAEEHVPDGMHVVLDGDDAYGMPDDEAAVPGWGKSRVLGSERPWNEV